VSFWNEVMVMSLRLKMTFLFSGVLALAMLFFGLIVYFFMDRNLNAGADRAIVEIAEDVVRSTRIMGSYPMPLRQVELPALDVFATPNTYIQVVDQEGSIVAQSENLGGQIMPLGEETLWQIDAGNGFHETVMSGKRKIRVYNRPLTMENEVIGVLQVGQNLSPVEDALNRLRLLLILWGGVTLFFTGTLGWFLASAALKPIGRIAETAQAIQQAQDLNRRINYMGPRDEVGNLAETLNQMLERLYYAYRDLEEAESVQRRFVSDASHELRTPLTTIRGNAELLRKMGDIDPETRAEALDDIICEAERMSRLVSSLLALARADSGFKLEMSPVLLEALLSETFRQAVMLAGDVELIADDLDAFEGAIIWANVDYLKQLIFILLNNAFQYTKSGGAVLVKGKRQDGMVKLLVIDNGVGIAEKDRPFIFDRFYRADKNRHNNGTGLGLAIAKWIVEQHGGTISVKSEEGKGSEFSVRLPLIKAEEARDGTNPNPALIANYLKPWG